MGSEGGTSSLRPLTKEEIRQWAYIANLIAKLIEVAADSVEAKTIIVMIGCLIQARYSPKVLYELLVKAIPNEVFAARMLIEAESTAREFGEIGH